MVNNRQSQPHFQNWNIAFEISNIRKLTESNNFKKSLGIFDIVPGCQRFFFLLLYLAFIHFLVSSRTSLVKLSEIKKSMGSCTGFQNRHFTVSKDISTEYFIQMNKARLCCTFFSDGRLRMLLTLFRFLLLHEKGSRKILLYRRIFL